MLFSGIEKVSFHFCNCHAILSSASISWCSTLEPIIPWKLVDVLKKQKVMLQATIGLSFCVSLRKSSLLYWTNTQSLKASYKNELSKEEKLLSIISLNLKNLTKRKMKNIKKLLKRELSLMHRSKHFQKWWLVKLQVMLCRKLIRNIIMMMRTPHQVASRLARSTMKISVTNMSLPLILDLTQTIKTKSQNTMKTNTWESWCPSVKTSYKLKMTQTIQIVQINIIKWKRCLESKKQVKWLKMLKIK